MTDAELIAAMATVRDKLVIAITDVERGDHLRASDALNEATAHLVKTINQLKAAA